MRPWIPLLVGAALASSAPAAAQQETARLVPDRPGFSDGVAVVQVTHVAAGYSLTAGAGSMAHSVGELLIRFPLRERLEVRVGLGSYTWATGEASGEAGLQNGSLGLKYRLRDAAGADDPWLDPALSVVTLVTVPTGSLGRPVRPESKLVASWALSDRLALDSNLGLALDATDSADVRRYALQSYLSAVLGYAVSDRVGSFVEVVGFLPADAFVDGGVTYRLRENLQADAWVGTTPAIGTLSFGAGLAYVF